MFNVHVSSDIFKKLPSTLLVERIEREQLNEIQSLENFKKEEKKIDKCWIVTRKIK